MGCNSGTLAKQNANLNSNLVKLGVTKGIAQLTDGFYLMRMGSGYDSYTNTATSGQTCLKNGADEKNIFIANPNAIMTFSQQQSISALQNALNVNVSGDMGGDRFGGSISAKFANDSKDNAYALNLIYLYQYAGKAVYRDGTLGQGLSALTPYAAKLETASPTAFRTMCGNQFIEQMNAGVVLGVRLTLNFNSHTDQEHFKAELRANLGLANIASAIEEASAHSKIHTDLTLSAVQLGGQPEKLNEIFGSPDSAGTYPFLNCQSQSNETGKNACNLMISNIIAYAETIEKQVTRNDGSLVLERLFYYNPITTNYSNLGIPTNGVTDPGADILAAMQQLTRDYDKALYDYNFVSQRESPLFYLNYR